MNWKDKVVLVTGGTGSFGKKFIEIMLKEYHPAKIIIFSRDELKQYEMQINGFNTMNHFFYRDDCLSFLRENHDLFDLIFCDPPTFSNSKGRDTFDVQRDHGYLIRSCMRHLSSDGVLIFSTNYTRFKMFGELYEDFIIEDITESTIGDDFARNSRIPRCYRIRHKVEQALVIEPPKKTVKRLVKKG